VNLGEEKKEEMGTSAREMFCRPAEVKGKKGKKIGKKRNLMSEEKKT